ncbi:hypothetical protein [Streptomyces sp. x-80]
MKTQISGAALNCEPFALALAGSLALAALAFLLVVAFALWGWWRG